MKLKSILSIVLMFCVGAGVSANDEGTSATVKTRTATKKRTTTQKATSKTGTAKKRTTTSRSASSRVVSSNLPGAIGRDAFTSIKRKVILKCIGVAPEDNPSGYTEYEIDIKWPTDIRLAGTGGSGAIAERKQHDSRVEEIQALMVHKLLDVYGTSDMKAEIDKLVKPNSKRKIVSSIPSSAYAEFPDYIGCIIEPYLSCNKWICFELTKDNGSSTYVQWVIIPRNQAAWNRMEITLISALQPWNYSDNVATDYWSQISGLIKASSLNDGSYDLIRQGNGVGIPHAIRPEKTGMSFIYYGNRGSYIDVFVSYEKLKPYIHVYDLLAGGTGWVKY